MVGPRQCGKSILVTFDRTTGAGGDLSGSRAAQEGQNWTLSFNMITEPLRMSVKLPIHLLGDRKYIVVEGTPFSPGVCDYGGEFKRSAFE